MFPELKKIYDFKLYEHNEDYYRIYNEIDRRDLTKVPSFRLVKKLLNVRDGDVVLDAGCGVGHFLNYVIDKKTVMSIGIDSSDAALKLAKSNFKGSYYSKQDLRHISFKNETFDKILCFNVIEHIYEQEKVMIEFRRILKKQGVLVIGTNIKDSIQWWMYQKFIGEHTHVREFTAKEFVEFAGKYFKILEHKKSSGVFRFGPPLRWVFHYVLRGDIILQCKK